MPLFTSPSSSAGFVCGFLGSVPCRPSGRVKPGSTGRRIDGFSGDPLPKTPRPPTQPLALDG